MLFQNLLQKRILFACSIANFYLVCKNFKNNIMFHSKADERQVSPGLKRFRLQEKILELSKNGRFF